MDEQDSSTSWSDWTQGVLGGVIDKYTTAQWVQPYQVEQMRLKALGELGVYSEGQRNPAAVNQVAGVNTSTIVMIGAALVVAMLIMRN